MPTPTASLDDLARPQAGVISRGQLLVAGWSSSAIARALSSSRLVVVAPGLYRTVGAPWTRRAAQHAAVLLAGQGAVLARWAAAELHGFADPRSGPLDVLAPHSRKPPASADGLLRLRRTRNLPPEERCEVEGLPVTTGERTVVDLAGTLSASRLAEVVAAGVRVRACTIEGIRAVTAAHPNVYGRSRLRAVLTLLDDDGVEARSDVEIAALHALVDAGLPRPVVALRVLDDHGHFIAEVDLAYPSIRLAIEIDGFRWHSSPARKLRDEERQNRLVLAGWTVLRFSANEVRTRPQLLVGAVRRVLEGTKTLE